MFHHCHSFTTGWLGFQICECVYVLISWGKNVPSVSVICGGNMFRKLSGSFPRLFIFKQKRQRLGQQKCVGKEYVFSFAWRVKCYITISTSRYTYINIRIIIANHIHNIFTSFCKWFQGSNSRFLSLFGRSQKSRLNIISPSNHCRFIRPADDFHPCGPVDRHLPEVNEKYGDVVAVGHRSGFMMIVPWPTGLRSRWLLFGLEF